MQNNAEGIALCIVLAEPDVFELALWVREVLEQHFLLPCERIALCNVGQEDGNKSRFYTAALSALKERMNYSFFAENNYAGNDGTKADNVLCLIISIFFDGQSEAAKAEFIQLWKLFSKKEAENSGNSSFDGIMSLDSSWFSKVHFIMQTVNAKKGIDVLKDNSEALVRSLRKKISLGGVAQHVDPHDAKAVTGTTRITAPPSLQSTSSLVLPASELTLSEVKKDGVAFGVENFSEAAVSAAIYEGQGECFILVSGDTMEEFHKHVEELQMSAKKIGAGCVHVVTKPREVQVARKESHGNSGTCGTNTTAGSNKKRKVIAQEFFLRKNNLGEHIGLRLAMCGNVDSGKSTLTSVLTRGCRDDGRGYARAFVFNHKHESTSGRTSSISENFLGFSSTGKVVNHTVSLTKRGGGSVSNGQLAQLLMEQSAKVLTLYDLAGHERYLKTTVLGMTRNMPDYACVVISANNGIQRMTKEHIGLCIALKIPFFVVITRIDSTPDNVRQETLENIHKLLKTPAVRKLPFMVRREEDVLLCAKNLRCDRITPIFEVSNVKGNGIEELLCFLNLLPLRKDWRKARSMPQEMVIDNIFFVTGIGTVVGGVITQGVFHVNDAVLLGPDIHGAYRTVHIKSIHVKGREILEAVAGSDATFCLKKEKRNTIRKGNILVDLNSPVAAYWQFEADVRILYHSTTILANYEPVIHSTTVRQSARIVYVAKEILRTGDCSLVRFHFCYKPEFMKVGQQLIFREGRTRGVGTVTSLIAARDESFNAKKRVKKLKNERH